MLPGTGMKEKAATDNLKILKSISRQMGVDLIASTEIDRKTRSDFSVSIREISRSLGFGVVIGMRLSGPVLETVEDAPTWTYYFHYRNVNYALDQVTLRLCIECQRRGFEALPIPASQILDWNYLTGHLSHKRLAWKAGLGWIGRNNLLVNPDYGARVRYATVLTDMPLPVAQRKEFHGCGDCRKCEDICPVGAIHDSWEDFDMDRCAAQLRRFSKTERLNTMICGLCVRVCDGNRE
jgi:epoxyqueuosine reductase